VAAAAATFLATSAVAGFGWLGSLTRTSEMVQWTSVPTAVGMAIGYALRLFGHPDGYAAAVAVTRAAGVVLLAGIGLTLVWRAARRVAEPDAVLRYAAYALAALAVLSPVFYPWYALPALAVLAATGVAPRVVAAGTLLRAALVLPDGLGLAVKTKLPGALLVVIVLGVVARRAVSAARRGGRATPRSTG
jgi:hypothetical protein